MFRPVITVCFKTEIIYLDFLYEIKEESGVDMAALKAVQKNRLERGVKKLFLFFVLYKYL